MPQIIYTDTALDGEGLPLNTTPFATYAVADLETILDCIVRGEIQCGTGADYPVDWPSNAEENLPWINGQPHSTIPWNQY